jgi:hypothetical protein
MSSGLKLLSLCSISLLFSWACAPDLDSLVASYGAGSGGGGASSATTNNPNAGKGGTDDMTGDSGATTVGPASCDNNGRDANESDVDCGGTSDCKRCGTNAHCGSNRDCTSGFCKSTRCAEPTCTDKVKNQDETAPDCGGSCPGCDLGVACDSNEDCQSEFCKDSVCADHCSSGKKESDETDKDCGGPTCGACGDNQGCVTSTDCQSKLCTNSKCQPGSCTDKILNQDESEKDCGGVCSLKATGKPCSISQACNHGEDCDSLVCYKSKCVADIDVPAGDMIDDFEDGNVYLPTDPALGDRIGNWYAYGDGTGVPTADGSTFQRGQDSAYVLRATGSGFTSWGSGVGVDLDNAGGQQSTKVPYDASAYSGITFWARAEAPLAVTFTLPTKETDPSGGVCDAANSGCDHHYYQVIQVDQYWKRYTVNFIVDSKNLALEPGGKPKPTGFHANELVAVQFRMASGQDYELYIDDVAFVK